MSNTLTKLFYDVQVECPYGRPFTAVYRQAHFGALPNQIMERFLEAGFRRNGNYLYTMVCPDCRSCVPIRLEPARFVANRNQKRVQLRNRDLTVTTGPVRITSEKLALCDKFLRSRFPGKGNSAIDYYTGFFINSSESTYELEFRHGGQLIGVSIIDLYPEAINCVYFYFDPDEARRSPGTNNILTLIDFALSHQIPYLYLGYWIDEIAAMRYKAKFNPHFLLRDGQWLEQPRP
jgi:arginyl-tRNA--protein-N-Asp/Glu arginylyltransferase